MRKNLRSDFVVANRTQNRLVAVESTHRHRGYGEGEIIDIERIVHGIYRRKRKVKIKKEAVFIASYNQWGYKWRKLPKKIELNEEFLYNYGLWLSDGCGLPRVGLTNTQPLLIASFKNFLTDVLHQNIDEIHLDVIKSGFSTQKTAFSIYVFNSPLYRVLKRLKSYLPELSREKIVPLLAGIFDGDGCIYVKRNELQLYSGKSKEDEDLWILLLKKLGLKPVVNYDKSGARIKVYNADRFFEEIFPYVKHPEKKMKILLLHRTGNIES